MSLFRKPKKIQRRVFTNTLDEDDEGVERRSGSGGGSQPTEIDDEMEPPPPPKISLHKKTEKSNRESKKSSKTDTTDTKAKSLLSFADDEEDVEVFQVRKSSYSKKMMRMMDKERRKKRRDEERESNTDAAAKPRDYSENGGSNGKSYSSSSSKYKSLSPASVSSAASSATAEQSKSNKSDSIQTEIRTDDFVLVVKKSESSVVLNGRAALCAGRDDMSDEDEGNRSSEDSGSHRFSKPEQLKQMLESGSIPDAAMIHAARKRRQKAREQGDFIAVEEPKEVVKKGSRLAREDIEGDNSDDEERVDMNGITGVKEREERREQFYSVENDYTEEDSDHEMNEWENQQIRKGVTGAQLVSAQQESVLSRFMIKSSTNATERIQEPPSTSTLLEQAYAKSSLEKPQQILAATKVKKAKAKAASLRTPVEIREAISTRLTTLRELNSKHRSDIDRMTEELNSLRMEEQNCKKRAPTAAAKYRFYQEVKCYVGDLVDCLNEKTPLINDLEKQTLQTISKYQNYLIERRRQDVRDQAKEMAEATKPAPLRVGPELEMQKRRAAEREGRRTRRRYEREKSGLVTSHLDGMSSDDETAERFQIKGNLEQYEKEADNIFNDVNDEFCKIELVLTKFYAWRKTDMESYKDAFVSICLPKILGPLIRLEMLCWSPLLEDNKDVEKMIWYVNCMLYAWSESESVETLRTDPDSHLVPTLIEKIVIPKVKEIVTQCWDPLSTTQTLRLIGFVNRLGRDYAFTVESKPMQQLFSAVLDKMKLALDSDVFIPIFPKQVQEARTSFFQRQFCSGLKLFRNFLSWQGIIADKPLRDLAIGSLLNRYLLLAMRVCTAYDAISKAYIIVHTLPTAWLQPESDTLKSLHLFTSYIKQTFESCDATDTVFMQTCEKAKQILQRLHSL